MSYIKEYTKGLGTTISSDPIVTSLFIGSVAVGARKGVLAGVATYFLGYAAMAEVTNHANCMLTASGGLQRALLAPFGHHDLAPVNGFTPDPPSNT